MPFPHSAALRLFSNQIPHAPRGREPDVETAALGLGFMWGQPPSAVRRAQLERFSLSPAKWTALSSRQPAMPSFVLKLHPVEPGSTDSRGRRSQINRPVHLGSEFKWRAGRRKCWIFTRPKQKPGEVGQRSIVHEKGETRRLARGLRGAVRRIAPNPVRGLWTACTRLKIRVLTSAYFSLTEKIEGVQQDRSLTAS